MDNIGEIVHVKSVESSAGSVADVEQIESFELGSVGMIVDCVEQNENVEGGGSEFMSVDDAERVQIVEEGIFAVNVVGDAK
ncbi:hypothetical protein CTI12_AA115620 [Artemisia annua]|uniref:Uncharacterized protein n=1 Tax=Artemisia annua TaxID=35608 RepID=A0A2U1PT59_ARTAN|nr:hypothetical protein CTI12_AA115620 [Artemisia annua]